MHSGNMLGSCISSGRQQCQKEMRPIHIGISLMKCGCVRAKMMDDEAGSLQRLVTSLSAVASDGAVEMRSCMYRYRTEVR